jgi:hypothetical protein
MVELLSANLLKEAALIDDSKVFFQTNFSYKTGMLPPNSIVPLIALRVSYGNVTPLAWRNRECNQRANGAQGR